MTSERRPRNEKPNGVRAGGGPAGRKLRVAFVQRHCVEPLGVMHISSVLRDAGHETRLFVAALERDLTGEVHRWDPDVVGFQTLTGQHGWVLATARWLRALSPRLKVVLGGPHATYQPEIVEAEGVDVVVRGEGEYIMRDLCAAIGARDDWTAVPGTWTKDSRGEVRKNPLAPLVEDLDALPFADRELPYRYAALHERRNRAFIGGRGCHNPCTFCHNHLGMRLFRGLGPWVRRRSPALLLEEIQHVRQRYPLDILNFENDDDILSTPGWAEELFTAYRSRVGLPFYLMTRVDHVTEDTARLLKAAGCAGVSLSLETANDRIRQEVLAKRFTTEQFLRATELLRRFELPAKVYNLVGIPGEALDDALATLRLNIDVRPAWAMCSILQPYPPTKLYQMCRDRGLFRRDVGANDFSEFYLDRSLLDLPNIDAMVNLQKFFPLVVRRPRLLGAVEKLIRMPPNALFDGIGLAAYAVSGARSHRFSWAEIARMAWRSRRVR